MKIIISILMVLAISYANDKSTAMKLQCQYIVYGNGIEIDVSDAYLYGIVAGQIFITPMRNRTSIAKDSTNAIIAEVACKEAFSINNKNNFETKFQFGASIVIDKNFAKYSNLK